MPDARARSKTASRRKFNVTGGKALGKLPQSVAASRDAGGRYDGLRQGQLFTHMLMGSQLATPIRADW
uniref:Uncharacterized protein n=1 Tax=Ralstonia syzygii R24 TaxID=907261 RepID=G3ACC2_9RALS|nr:hypothetical protein RALSY_mp30532 [Ralstonia syzygii R24]